MQSYFIFGGPIYTMTRNSPAEAMLVIGDKVAMTGTLADARPQVPDGTRHIHLGGRAVYPGFHDSHIHFVMYALSRKRVNLMGVQTIRQALDIIRDAAASARRCPNLEDPSPTPTRWITGSGWDKSLWGRFPTRQELDSVAPDIPVCLQSKDCHSVWVNSRALEICGITREIEAPEGGSILRDDNGEPTGVLQDKAADLVFRCVPEPTHEFVFEACRDLIPALWKMGITCVHAPDESALFGLVRKLRLEYDLPIRVALMPPLTDLPILSSYGISQGYGDEWTWTAQIKMFKDGSLGSSTALLFEPYEHLPGFTGLDVTPLEELKAAIQKCVDAGYGAAVHAIGDRAVSETLDALETNLEASRKKGIRHRMEHAQMVHPKDLTRFRDLGVVASVQPSHAVADRYMAEREWGARSIRAYPFAKLLNSAATLAFGSDAPVDTPDPIYGIYCAVNRNLPGEPDEKMWHPEERLAAHDAILAYTRNAAYAAGKEQVLGDLSPGKYADFVVLSQDLLAVDRRRICDTRVEALAIGGRFVLEPEWL